MSKNNLETYKLYGYFEMLPIKTGFVTPIFENNQELYFEIDKDNLISSFEKIPNQFADSVEKSMFDLNIQKKNNESCLYAFKWENTIFYEESDGLITILSLLIKDTRLDNFTTDIIKSFVEFYSKNNKNNFAQSHGQRKIWIRGVLAASIVCLFWCIIFALFYQFENRVAQNVASKNNSIISQLKKDSIAISSHLRVMSDICKKTYDSLYKIDSIQLLEKNRLTNKIQSFKDSNDLYRNKIEGMSSSALQQKKEMDIISASAQDTENSLRKEISNLTRQLNDSGQNNSVLRREFATVKNKANYFNTHNVKVYLRAIGGQPANECEKSDVPDVYTINEFNFFEVGVELSMPAEENLSFNCYIYTNQVTGPQNQNDIVGGVIPITIEKGYTTCYYFSNIIGASPKPGQKYQAKALYNNQNVGHSNDVIFKRRPSIFTIDK